MPAMIFPATCSAENAPRKFIEFKIEACTPGDDTIVKQYGFRCLGCKRVVPDIVDASGHRHFWVEGQHQEA
ncbi:MAG: hypothetical protein ACYDCK_07715 [Thermoplasmatota archaeon]